jgi:hypothetical protein
MHAWASPVVIGVPTPVGPSLCGKYRVLPTVAGVDAAAVHCPSCVARAELFAAAIPEADALATRAIKRVKDAVGGARAFSQLVEHARLIAKALTMNGGEE